MRNRWVILILSAWSVSIVAVAAYAAGQAKMAAPEVIRARHFELVDVAGRVRAELGFWPDGSPGIVFYDERGSMTAVLPARVTPQFAPRPDSGNQPAAGEPDSAVRLVPCSGCGALLMPSEVETHVCGELRTIRPMVDSHGH